jgi:hypothetical protein
VTAAAEGSDGRPIRQSAAAVRRQRRPNRPRPGVRPGVGPKGRSIPRFAPGNSGHEPLCNDPLLGYLRDWWLTDLTTVASEDRSSPTAARKALFAMVACQSCPLLVPCGDYRDRLLAHGATEPAASQVLGGVYVRGANPQSRIDLPEPQVLQRQRNKHILSILREIREFLEARARRRADPAAYPDRASRPRASALARVLHSASEGHSLSQCEGRIPMIGVVRHLLSRTSVVTTAPGLRREP